MKVSVSGSSYAQRLGLHDPAGAGPLAAPTSVGPLGSYADRTYDNGYVKIDPGTGNAASLDPNTTWNWGFNDPGQYNAGAQTLSFSRQGAPGYRTLANNPARGGDDQLGAGVQLVAGVRLGQSGNWTADLCVGFEAVWGQRTTVGMRDYRQDVRTLTTSDTYDVTGIGAGQFPVGGYQGTYLGPFDSPAVVPSPLIPNLPMSRATVMSGAALSQSYDQVMLTVDQSVYGLNVGPQLGYGLGHGVKLTVKPTVGINIVDAAVERKELFVQVPAGGVSRVVRQWRDEGKAQEVFFGMGVTGGLEVEMGRDYFGGIFGGYEWVSELANVVVGPNNVRLDASGWVVGLSVGKRF
jgi:hypothetical protein